MQTNWRLISMVTIEELKSISLYTIDKKNNDGMTPKK